MKKNYLSIIAIVMSSIALILSGFAFNLAKRSINEKVISPEGYVQTPSTENDSTQTIATHSFDQTLIGTWSDTEWLLTIMPDSSVYLEQLNYGNNTKSYLSAAPRLYIGYIENSAIMISYKSNVTYEEYSMNSETVEKTAYNVTVTLIREGTDSFKLKSLESQNTNYSFRREN